ncbi:MAG TPA: hypothetical protein VF240_22285 [Pyrinomonadaceae bacterium]
MILRNKLVPVALGAALLGGSVGAFVMRPTKSAETQVASAVSTTPSTATAPAKNFIPASTTADTQALPANNTENECYREGFAEGFRAAREEGLESASAVAAPTRAGTTERVAYRSAPRTRYVRSRSAGNSRQVYYDYNQPQKRSFWQKHRDKLTVAMGAGGGALIGGLIGGKKGAGIGALAGGGGSALYTYKLRKRDRRY